MDQVSQIIMDVSGTINVTDPQSVCEAVIDIYQQNYSDVDVELIQRLYDDFASLYQGSLEGFLACDTTYHDMQHVLDVSLATARLIDGYDKSHTPTEQLGAELAEIGLIIALFHDSGYIRRVGEADIKNGAQYTKIHVSRSAQFMAEYLPTIGREDIVEITGKLVHFTGYEYDLDDIEVNDPKHKVLGSLVGTADVIAQMADPAYLEKCRDRLYPEFELGGMTRQQLPDGGEKVIYESAQDLLIKTPQFIKATISNRLDSHFKGMYRFVERHFEGSNLYMDALEANCRHLEGLIAQNDLHLLNSSSLRP